MAANSMHSLLFFRKFDPNGIGMLTDRRNRENLIFILDYLGRRRHNVYFALHRPRLNQSECGMIAYILYSINRTKRYLRVIQKFFDFISRYF